MLDSASEEDEDALSAEFARELAEGMENLMKEITGGNQSEGDQTEAERARAFKAAWEAMLVEGLDGTSADGGLPDLGQVLGQDGVGPSTSNKAGGETTGFQDKIKQAMDKLKESESKVQVSDLNFSTYSKLSTLRLIRILNRVQAELYQFLRLWKGFWHHSVIQS